MSIDPLAALAAVAPAGAWLVGGAVRDELLGRPTSDFDVALEGDPRDLARGVARRVGGHAFELSEGFGGWRIVARDHAWQLDLIPLAGDTITGDLAARDLTINAIARPLSGGEPLDPHGGIADLRAGVLRQVGPDSLGADSVRVLRVARFAAELGFVPEPDTVAAGRAAAPGLASAAPERMFAEFKRLIASPDPLAGLDTMDALGATAAVLPELESLAGVEQSRYHHLDVRDHTRAVLAETVALTNDPARAFPGSADALAAVLAEPLANELTRGEAMRFGALLHDIAKPATRAVAEGGGVTFIGHDREGAAMAETMLRRLRAAERLSAFVGALVRHHLRAGFLVHEAPLSRRAIYRYLHSTEPVAVEVTLLSVADRLATLGRGADEAVRRHLDLARQLMAEALEWRASPPRPPLRGDELARELGITAGPELGRLLAELEQAAFAGEISGREAALSMARALQAPPRD